MAFLGIFKFLLYLLITLLLMGVLVFVHELGHYLTARACRVTIYEFAIGMGKRIGGFTSKKTGIMYSIRLFPIGGYVSMAGEDETKEGEEDDPNAFNKKNVWQRIVILVAGAGMNVLTGFLAMLVLTAGMTLSGFMLPSTTVAEFAQGAPSYVSGLELGDRIVSIDGVKVHTGYDLSYEIMFNGYKPVDVVVEREGRRVLIPDVRFPTGEEQGILLGGMDFNVLAAESSVGNVLKTSFYRGVSSIKMVFDSLGGIITGRFSLADLSGPIGMTTAVQEVATQPMAGWNILYLFAIIAMNLGVMNLLPLPALDGGRLFFRFVEVLRFGKPVNEKLEGTIHGMGMMLLLALMVIITFKDVIKLF
ncbi:MAG: RIP metalloprotease RseP [Ruminococcaceae bacterium]|nr:RIP metalloprotease RseP [Oscillospiraceae bacterium]